MNISTFSTPRDYSFIAPVYDTLFHRPLAEGHQKIGQLMRKEKRRLGKLDILEVGVGSGLTLNFLPTGSRFTGIDVNPKMLHMAEDKASKMKNREIDLQCMNAERLAIKNNSFDVVLAPSVLSAVDKPMLVLKEMIRVTKRGGKIAIITNLRDSHSVKSKCMRVFDPITRALLGFRLDLTRESFAQFKNLKCLEETQVNSLLGFPLSTYMLFEKV